MTVRKPGEGSRFLYDSFDAAHARIEANERVAEERWAALEFRLSQIDAAVYGVAAFLLTQGAEALIRAAGK